MRDVNVKVLLIVFVLLFAGCIGGGKTPTTTVTDTSTTTTTTVQVAITQPETTMPPPTTPPPWAYLFSKKTPFSEVIPAGAEKTKPLTDKDYDFVLKFPSKPADYDDGIKALYENPTGTVYILRFKSASGAAKFFEFALNKIEKGDETIERRTLTKGGQQLDVYHRTEYAHYFGTLVQKGVFIYYLQMQTSAYDAESYITENLDYLFVPDIEDAAQSSGVQTINVDLSSSATPLAEVIPKGASITSISKNDYEYTLEFPERTYSYDKDIKARYSAPAGNIYVIRFKNAESAEEFYSQILSKFKRSDNINTLKVVLTADGKSLDAYNKLKGSTYVGTVIHKGVFIYYVKMGKDQFESETYIESSMGYLFE